jgi:hypothetical protein
MGRSATRINLGSKLFQNKHKNETKKISNERTAFKKQVGVTRPDSASSGTKNSHTTQP